MKNLVFIVFVYSMLLPWASKAQGPAIITHKLCWTTPGGTDSTIIGHYLYSSRSATPLLINYLDAGGNSVTVSGGVVRVGVCSCYEVTQAAPAWIDPKYLFAFQNSPKPYNQKG